MKNFTFALFASLAAIPLAHAQERSSTSAEPPPVLLASSTNDFSRAVRDFNDSELAKNQNRRGLPSFGIDVGAFYPTSGRTKDAFGSRWTSFGPGVGFTVVTQPKFDPDFEILRQSRSGNDASIYLAGGRLLFPFSKPLGTAVIPTFAPYYGVGVNLNYIDIDAPDFDEEDKGFGIGGSAVLGASLGRRLFAEARYRVFAEKASFSLSGAQLVVGARF